jgi:hypothetical protein
MKLEDMTTVYNQDHQTKTRDTFEPKIQKKYL